MDEQTVKDKIRGSLVGGAVGDALGYPVEFISSYIGLQNRYGERGITRYELNENGKALISDDTQMTLFTACGLLNAIKDLVTAPISDEEKPFEMPESWEWCRLGERFSHNNRKQLNRADTHRVCHDYITTSNLYWDRFDLKEVRQMLFTDEELERCIATKGDLLVCEGGDVGSSAIWNYDYEVDF